MITPVSAISVQNKNPKIKMHPEKQIQTFKGEVGHIIPKVSPKSTFVKQIKEIFYELVPALNSTYRKMMKKSPTIQTVEPQVTQEKFRTPVEFIFSQDGHVLGRLNGKIVKEYSNPNAAKLHDELTKATNTKDKIRIAKEMGEYRIIDLDKEKKVDDFLNNIEKN